MLAHASLIYAMNKVGRWVGGWVGEYFQYNNEILFINY